MDTQIPCKGVQHTRTIWGAMLHALMVLLHRTSMSNWVRHQMHQPPFPFMWIDVSATCLKDINAAHISPPQVSLPCQASTWGHLPSRCFLCSRDACLPPWWLGPRPDTGASFRSCVEP